jgi:hypothetical protein
MGVSPNTLAACRRRYRKVEWAAAVSLNIRTIKSVARTDLVSTTIAANSLWQGRGSRIELQNRGVSK